MGRATPRIENLYRLEEELRDIERAREKVFAVLRIDKEKLLARYREATYIASIFREVLLQAEKRGFNWRAELRGLLSISLSE